MVTTIVSKCYYPLVEKFDNRYVKQLKLSFNLADFIQKERELFPAGDGNDYIGLCPFHAEDTKSFRVDSKRYHCFGCGAHGDIFSWLVRTRGITFPQAVRALSNLDVKLIDASEIVERQVPISSAYDAEAAWRVQEINDIAHTYFKRFYRMDEGAKDYGNQRLSKKAIATFNIGYAPDDNDFIYFMCQVGLVPEDELIAAALAYRHQDGSLVPRYKDRFTFPLTGPSGRILGFAGRLVPRAWNAQLPKYINPPDTAAFSKRRYLYGWQTVRNRGAVRVHEGFMDAISVHLSRGGIDASLALMGTALSESQFITLRDRFRYIFFEMDGDMPGLQAMAKIAKRQWLPGQAYACLLTNDVDPDTQYRQNPVDEANFISTCDVEDFNKDILVTKVIKPEYDRGNLDKLIDPYVKANFKDGFSQYNLVDWVIAAYPQYAKEIKAALMLMIKDPVQLHDGKLGLKDEHVKAFIKAWIKPCRDARKVKR